MAFLSPHHWWLLQTVKGLRFSLCESWEVSLLLDASGRYKLLDQRQRVVLPIAKAIIRVSASAPVSQVSVLTGQYEEGMWPLYTQWVLLWEKNPELQTCLLLLRETPSLSTKAVCCTDNVKRQSGAKAESASAVKVYRHVKTHGEVSPNSDHLEVSSC